MKITMIAIAMFVLTVTTKAQNLSFGPSAGIGHSWTNSEKGPLDRRFHVSYNIGGKLVYSFVSNWGISGDIRFSSEGQTLGTDADNKVTGRANYIRIPLQGIYFFNKFGDRIRPKVSIGPSFGFLVGGKTTTFDDGDKVNEIKTKEYAETFDFGLTAAAGTNIRIATATWLNLELAYYHGLTDIVKTGTDAKNRNLGINIGVTFPLATVRPDNLTK